MGTSRVSPVATSDISPRSFSARSSALAKTCLRPARVVDPFATKSRPTAGLRQFIERCDASTRPTIVAAANPHAVSESGHTVECGGSVRCNEVLQIEGGIGCHALLHTGCRCCSVALTASTWFGRPRRPRCSAVSAARPVPASHTTARLSRRLAARIASGLCAAISLAVARAAVTGSEVTRVANP